MLPSLALLAEAQRGVFTRAQALASGYTDDEIRARVRAGSWRRVRHGAYSATPPDDVRDAFLRRCWAALLVAGPGSVVSGPSACVVHGVDLVALPDVVHLCSPHARSVTGVLVRRATLGPADVTEVHGLRVTTLARSAVEAARELDHAEAVVAVDGVLRASDVDPAVLESMLPRGRDAVRARRVLRFADGRSESVGESLARVALAAAGVPPPELQRTFEVRSGRRYRVDFCWPEHRTIGEFDGRVKYRDDRPGVVWDEKRREDELRELGWAFVRFGAAEVRDPAGLARSVRAAFVRGRRLVA